ncbi:MAG: hypothetical protein HGA44_21570 [Cellulomonadaceae bacterium]|nr:hypothetical protein [Cellulomonadaceae bacterium]
MRPGSDLLRALADAPDPGVPYTLVRGVQPLPLWADRGVAARIVGKLAGVTLDAVFGGESHDLAVGAHSAGGAGSDWVTRPLVLDAQCNHMSFFASPEGLRVVSAALGTPAGSAA